ncbi:MAG: hypothetical protein ACREQL_13990 [Candidatus Binatia bacterium]
MFLVSGRGVCAGGGACVGGVCADVAGREVGDGGGSLCPQASVHTASAETVAIVRFQVDIRGHP